MSRITQFLPFLEPAIFYGRDVDDEGVAADTFTPYQLAKVRVMEAATAKRLTLSPELLAVTEKVIEVYENILAAVRAPAPQVDDVIVVGGLGWQIVAVVDDLNGTVHRCACKKGTAQPMSTPEA